MLNTPSSRRNREEEDEKLNLIPILDSVFILIFFLLTSAQFLKIYNIGGDAPIVSTTPPPKKKKNLDLEIKISKSRVQIFTYGKGSPDKSYALNKDSLSGFHKHLVNLKEKNPKETSLVVKVNQNVIYDDMVLVLDRVRYYKGESEEDSPLFNQLVFIE